jgi:uncharacterized membrane protein
VDAGSQTVESQRQAGKPTAAPAERIASIDLMRGIVMVIMAIDHVRDYFNPFAEPTDLSKASAGLFLTRWITHFCAPTFVFLAGTSAFLYARNSGATRGQLQRFLLTRGLWLVLLELSWISFCWRFDFNGLNLQVIWALGWSMVCLAGLLFLPRPLLLGVGAALVLGHNLFDRWHFQDFAVHGEAWGWLWALLHETHFATLGSGYQVLLLYPLVPWIGVMALGYGFGALLQLPRPRREHWMRVLGLGAIALFLLLRLGNLYGEPQAWSDNPRGPLFTALNVLNVSKYPPSLHYLLMTLGPVLLLLPLLERWRGGLARRITVFGRVPFFFYLLHLPLIHLGALIAALLVYGVSPQLIGPSSPPPGYEPSLLRVYLVWALVLLILYPMCRRYADYKARHKEQWWLSYL